MQNGNQPNKSLSLAWVLKIILNVNENDFIDGFYQKYSKLVCLLLDEKTHMTYIVFIASSGIFVNFKYLKPSNASRCSKIRCKDKLYMFNEVKMWKCSLSKSIAPFIWLQC